MRNVQDGLIVLTVALCTTCPVWGQGGNRGGRAQQQQTAAPAATPPAAQQRGGGRNGGAAIAAPANSEFFNYDTTAAGGMPIPEGAPVETHQKITLNGEAITYTARAGFLPLRNATTGQPEAHIFFTSYAKEGVTDAASRPMLFFVGGAPGVAASWQEFGGLGPKRMKWAADGSAGVAPYTWADNPHTLLGQADLVFVNPVGTAFSRPDQPSRGPNFWNTSADIASLAEFVRSYVGMSGRRNSPLFLAGEDTGTGRTAGLALYLTEHNVPVQGVVLLSMTMSPDSQAGDTQYLTLFPSLVMTAWQHKKLSPELSGMSAEQISGQARQFASREYLHALYKGDRMTADERAKVLADLSRLTGLPKQFFINNNLRPTLDRFAAELFREQHLGLSLSDARVTGFVPPAAGGGGRGAFLAPITPFDVNHIAKAGGFHAAYEDYLRHELNFTAMNNAIYYLSNGGVSNFAASGSDETSLSGALARNPNMRVFASVNFYDLNAPFYATEYTLAHLNVSAEARTKNITISHYESGLMAYADNKALAKLHADLARFVTEGHK